MKRLALALLVMALAVRALVPAGWMPSGERAFALTVCTGVDTKTIWMDSKGGLHKENPAGHKQSKHEPCAFAGNADIPNLVSANAVAVGPESVDAAQPLQMQPVNVGQGLAAPPPPQTGPPILI